MWGACDNDYKATICRSHQVSFSYLVPPLNYMCLIVPIFPWPASFIIIFLVLYFLIQSMPVSIHSNMNSLTISVRTCASSHLRILWPCLQEASCAVVSFITSNSIRQSSQFHLYWEEWLNDRRASWRSCSSDTSSFSARVLMHETSISLFFCCCCKTVSEGVKRL